MFLAIIIFIALVIEVLKYLTGGKSKDFWGWWKVLKRLGTNSTLIKLRSIYKLSLIFYQKTGWYKAFIRIKSIFYQNLFLYLIFEKEINNSYIKKT